MRYENKKFIFKVSATANRSVKPTSSPPLSVVTHRLIITASAPALWYKDQGGKENCIELPVQLIDQHSKLVKTRRVPLKLTLLYENGTPVPKQDILRNCSTMAIGETGQHVCRIRIEEVSRSHQKQNFQVLIAPDTIRYPLNNDISPCQSTPVDVMSKQRATPSAAAVGHILHAPVGTEKTLTTQGLSGKKRKNEEDHSSLPHHPSASGPEARPTQVQRLRKWRFSIFN
jgi:hypothetical protein